MLPVIHLGPLTFYSFGLALGLAICVGCATFAHYFKLHNLPVKMPTLAVVLVSSAFIGAKLDDAFLNQIAILHGHPFSGSAVDIVSGGYTWLGSLIFALAAGLAFARFYHIPCLRGFDVTFCVGLSYAIGRIGCFLAGDGDYGLPSNLPWAMSFPHGTAPTTFRVHPTMLYQSAWELLLFAFLWKLSNPRRNPGLRPGTLLGLYLIFSGLGRFLVEFLSLNGVLAFGLKEAQIVSLGFIIFGAALLAVIYKREPTSQIESSLLSAQLLG